MQTVKHSQKKMFWGFFSFSGAGALTPIEEMMNSACYTNLIRRTVTVKGFPESRGVLQQDLDPCLTSKQVKNVFNQAAIRILDWPGYLPDLNPIKNL